MKQLIALILIILNFSCDKAPKPNEPFYCKVDGTVFRPDNGGDTFFEALLAQRDEKNKLFSMTVYSASKGWIVISAKFNDIKDFKEKNYIINEEFKGSYSTIYKTVNGVGSQTVYETYSNSGFVNFTKVDTLKQQVSGVFEFKAKDKKTEKIISITKGQFNDVFFY